MATSRSSLEDTLVELVLKIRFRHKNLDIVDVKRVATEMLEFCKTCNNNPDEIKALRIKLYNPLMELTNAQSKMNENEFFVRICEVINNQLTPKDLENISKTGYAVLKNQTDDMETDHVRRPRHSGSSVISLNK